MRHTFASNLPSRGKNPTYTAKLLGHKTTEMVMRHYGRWVEQGAALGYDRPPGALWSIVLSRSAGDRGRRETRVKNE